GWELTPTCAYETPATTSSGSAAGADTSISRPVAAVSMEKLSGAVATWAWAGTGCTAARLTTTARAKRHQPPPGADLRRRARCVRLLLTPAPPRAGAGALPVRP